MGVGWFICRSAFVARTGLRQCVVLPGRTRPSGERFPSARDPSEQGGQLVALATVEAGEQVVVGALRHALGGAQSVLARGSGLQAVHAAVGGVATTFDVAGAFEL